MKTNPEERREALQALGIRSIGPTALSAKQQKALAAEQRSAAREELRRQVEEACAVPPLLPKLMKFKVSNE